MCNKISLSNSFDANAVKTEPNFSDEDSFCMKSENDQEIDTIY
jgi:hypothetical protein